MATNPKLLYRQIFKTEGKSDGQGKTGSVKAFNVNDKENINDKGHPWRLKFTILKSTFIRKTKVDKADVENFGEHICAKVATALTVEGEIPEVRLVPETEQNNSALHIASRYFEEKSVTLDDWAKEQGCIFGPSGHVQFVKGVAGPGQISLDHIPDNLSPDEKQKLDTQLKMLRKDLATAIAVSAAIGDHDPNPGNMVKKGDNFNRIDLGHGLYHLVSTMAAFGGGIGNKNRVIDYMNREQIGGWKLGDISKLWRDYPGMMPSQELTDAFLEVSMKKDNIAAAISEAQVEFFLAYESADPQLKVHIIYSLNQIYKNLTGTLLPEGDHQQMMDTMFKAMQKAFVQNCDDMAYTAQLMQLQVNIDTAIKTNNPVMLATLKEQYHDIRPAPDTWIKTTAEIPACKGNFDEYVEQRRAVLTPPPLKKTTSSNDFKNLFIGLKKSNSSSSLKSLDNGKFLTTESKDKDKDKPESEDGSSHSFKNG